MIISRSFLQFPGDAYEAFKYPGGEWQVRLKPETMMWLGSTGVTVTAKVRNADEFMQLLLLGDAIAGFTGFRPALDIAYLPYARADRRFREGDCVGLEVAVKMLSIFFSTITTLDVHNPVACGTSVQNASPARYIAKAIQHFSVGNDVTVLFPDEGARNRYADMTGTEFVYRSLLGLKVCQIHKEWATKTRNPETGELSGFEVPHGLKGNVLIVDDICDGGGTFVGIADALQAAGFEGRLGLYVTHGIFSKGTAPLVDRFVRIYTTDSFYETPLGGSFVTVLR